MKRRFAWFFAALLTVLTLTACGGGRGAGSDTAGSASAGDMPADYAESSTAWGLEAPSEPQEAPAVEEDTQDRLANAKMVYTANVEAETTDFDACAAGLESLVARLGGYLEYASTGSYGDGTRSGNYTARIPSAQFDSFLQGVGEIGHVVNQDRNAENISERYYDTESRLTTQRTKLERLQALLAKAENMEDIITLESAIAETELQIEQLTGSLRHYDALVDFATVELRLREVVRLTTVEDTPPTFGSRLGSAFADGLHSFGDFLQSLAIFLAYNWTWLVLLVLIAFLAVKVSRRRQAVRQPGERKPGWFRREQKAKKPDDK